MCSVRIIIGYHSMVISLSTVNSAWLHDWQLVNYAIFVSNQLVNLFVSLIFYSSV